MIDTFVQRFEANKTQLESALKTKHPENYKELVTKVIEVITSDDYYDIDPERIHEINDGDYQGTLLYVIASKGYQPSDYWSCFVSYGSCSGCDTLQGIHGYNDEPPNDEQIKEYMTLCLHIVQGLKEMKNEDTSY
jgi:hypothetical protein